MEGFNWNEERTKNNIAIAQLCERSLMVKISLNVIIYALHLNDNKVLFHRKFFNKFNALFPESLLYFDGANFITTICSTYYVFEGFLHCCSIVNPVRLRLLMFRDFHEPRPSPTCSCNKEY